MNGFFVEKQKQNNNKTFFGSVYGGDEKRYSHMFFQMLMKRKNSDRHIMDVSIFMELMNHHHK
jgi:hypothetical protein